MDSAVPYSLSDIQLPDSPSNIVKATSKATSKKEGSSSPPHKDDSDGSDSHSDSEVQRNGINSSSKSYSKNKPVESSNNKCRTLDKDSNKSNSKRESRVRSKVSDTEPVSTLEKRIVETKDKDISNSEDKSSRVVEKKKDSLSTGKDVDSESSRSNSSSSEESSDSDDSRKRRQPKSKISINLPKSRKNRSPSSSSSDRSSQSRESSPNKSSKYKSSPDKSSKDESSPDKSSKDKRSLDKLSKDKRSPDKLSKDKRSPDKLSRDKRSPDKLPRDKRSPDKLSKDKRSPDKLSKDKHSPNKLTKDNQDFEKKSVEYDIPDRISKRSSESSSDRKTSQTEEHKKESSSDPPRKKLKINRNNIVISSLENSEKCSKIELKKVISSNEKISKTSSEKISKSTPEKMSKSTPEKISESSLDTSPKKEKIRESPSPIQSDTIEREMGEIIENSPEIKYEPRKLNFPGRKLNRKSSEDQASNEPKAKRSKWGKFTASQKSSQTINISTDSLKNWFPDFKLVSEPSVINESMPEDSPPVKEEKLSFPVKTDEEIVKPQPSDSNNSQQNIESTTETTTPIGPVSKIIFIQNLVRPFTLLQLKDLLRQTGGFVEEDFWIDKIKSKCFVTYETEEEAIKTRKALNGLRWPSSNPKILNAEFSTEDELELHRSGKDILKPIPERVPEVPETYEQKISQPISDQRRKDRESDKRKERDRYKSQAPIREWDKDKVSQESPERENDRKDHEGYRMADKKEKKDTKKRTNEDTPAKLLDDLFQKTKSVPCIYWLPLTEVQVLEREEAKRVRRQEREKKNQQREQEESEHRNKRPRSEHKSRDGDSRKSPPRSRSPTSRRR